MSLIKFLLAPTKALNLHMVKKISFYLKFLFEGTNKYNIHSPMVHEFIENILDNSLKYYCFFGIEHVRSLLLKQDEVIELNRSATAMNNGVDIKLVGEDYTIGKVLEYVLHEEDYKKNRTLSYVGFIKKHPHDDYSIIRVAFNDNEDIDVESDSNVYKMLKFACEISKNLFVNIKEYF